MIHHAADFLTKAHIDISISPSSSIDLPGNDFNLLPSVVYGCLRGRVVMACRNAGLMVLLILALVSGTVAQTVHSKTDGSTPLGLSPGAPAGSYMLSGFEQINAYNGHINFALPILSIGGRGAAGYTMMLQASNPSWRIESLRTPIFCGTPDEERPCWSYISYPQRNWWSLVGPGYGPGVLQGRRAARSPNRCQPTDGFFAETFTRLIFTSPDGTEHELFDELTGGNIHNYICVGPGPETSRGRVFSSKDGAGMTFVADDLIADYAQLDLYEAGHDLFFPAGFLKMKDGTIYRIENANVQWIRDRNGNMLTFTYDNNPYAPYRQLVRVKDSLGRKVNIFYNVQEAGPYGLCDQIVFRGFNGDQRIVRVSKDTLRNALRPNSGYAIKSYVGLFPQLPNASSADFNPGVISSMWLPDGIRRYRFYYNEYAELARVEVPTGGASEYDYFAGADSGYASGQIGDQIWGQINPPQPPDLFIYRRLKERRVLPEANTPESKTTYGRSTGTTYQNMPASAVVEDQVDPNASDALIARTRHSFFGVPIPSMVGHDSLQAPPDFYESKEGKTEFFGSNGSTVLRKVEHTWDPGLEGPPFVPHIKETLNTVMKGFSSRVSKQTFAYDRFNNPTETKEYDFGDGAAGTLVRRRLKMYLDTPAYTDAINSPHLRSLLTQESVFDSGGTEQSRTTYEYDSYETGLTDRPDIVGHDAVYGTANLIRGNPTAVSRFILPATPLLTKMKYDIAGNVVSATDPRGKITTYEFMDRFGMPDNEARNNVQAPPELGTGATYAFATRVTNALNQTAYTQYDYYLGKPINGEDSNGVVAKGSYADALDRPTELVVNIVAGTPFQRRTTFSYNDVARVITTQADQTTYNDGLFKNEMLYDGLGRTVESRKYEEGPTVSRYIATKQNYDAMGRVRRASNPYRPNANPPESLLWTTTTYDSFSRVVSVTTPDGAVLSQTYDGNETIVRDQANKQRRSISDGLGRLIQVDELTDSGTLYATTTYGYDVLDNLIQITQQSQQRFFRYDSMSRLIRAKNPEQNTNPALALPDGSQWCIGYSYDSNDNLKTRTDARNITMTCNYDDLNRPTSRTYSENTPAVNYYYDSQLALPSGSPSFATGASIGKLVAALYGGSASTTGNYTGYDAVGRASVSLQKTDTQVYQMSYGYDVAGEMVSETYPGTAGGGNGRVVRAEYDAAGRIAGIRNGATGPYYAGAAPGDGVNRIAYASHGSMSKMKMGNGLWEHTTFNVRLQPTQIGLGTTGSGAGSTSVLGLDYTYGVMTGAVLDPTKNNGNIESQSINAGGLSLKQSYTYDQVDRLVSAEEIRSGAQPLQQWKQTFVYDRFGNRNFDLVNTTPNVQGPNPVIDPATNRIQTGQSYGYDTAGNLTSDPATNPNALVYDAENRQISYTKNGTTQYTYDGDGRRVKKVDVSANRTTVFVYNLAGQLIAEYQTEPVTPPLGGGGTSYLTADHLGSTRVVTTAGPSPTVKARYDYLPFGEQIASTTGNRGSVAGYVPNDGTRQKFTQKERDSESGIDYFGRRYYSSAQGRFTSADDFARDSHVASPQSWNKFAYARNNPLRYFDPTGEEATVTIKTDEKSKTGTITINATFALWADDSGVSEADLQKAAGDYKKQIEDGWNGQFTSDGVTYTVQTTVDIQVYGSKKDAKNSGAQNVIAVTSDQNADDSTRSWMASKALGYGSADSGVWKAKTLFAAHEFGHLLGIDDKSGKDHLMDQANYKLPQKADAFDYDWAFSGAASNHRANSRQYRGDGNSLETRSSPMFKPGPYENRTSTRTMGAGPWWR